MLIENKILGLLGLSARARKFCFGNDSVLQELEKRKVYLIIIATDASDKTKKNWRFYSEKYNCKLIEISNIDNLSKAIGKSNKAVIGIEDENLASGIAKIYFGGDTIG